MLPERNVIMPATPLASAGDAAPLLVPISSFNRQLTSHAVFLGNVVCLDLKVQLTRLKLTVIRKCDVHNFE